MKELVRQLLRFQYESLGFGKYSCRSCGAYKTIDFGDHKTPSIEKTEECSKHCPWRLVKEELDK